MSSKTTISWCDATFNPWWGCQRVSPGCEHCYAETLSARYGHAVWGPAKTNPRRLFGDKHWAEPLAWDARAEREGRRLRVFCASMADVFEANSSIAGERARLFELISYTPHLDWLLLTKRPENMRVGVTLPADWGDGWPNVWLGTSTEDQQRADERIPFLLKTPAAVRFLSAEPLLGPVDLNRWIWGNRCPDLQCSDSTWDHDCELGEQRLHWIIAGGESGPGFRTMDLDWARSLRDQCHAAGVAYFYKQGSSRLPGKEPELDGRLWHEFPEARALSERQP